MKSAKVKFKEYKQNYKQGSKFNIQKAFQIRRTQKFQQTKRESKFERKKLTVEKKFKSKELKNQRKIKCNSNPGFLVLKPVKYTENRMKASAWQKAVNEDSDNDFMHVTDSVKRRIIEPTARKVSKLQRLQRQQKKRESLSERQKRSDQKLNRQENRLKEKSSKPPKSVKNRNIRNLSRRNSKILQRLSGSLSRMFMKKRSGGFSPVLLPLSSLFSLCSLLSL
ncbi:hypothetical protein [Ruminococcus sp. Marseille-P6503]|uniref:hypothetical protein n=1 Tax=Ruminococcus sp. Marseille-P6503 TaxID=2364796 RepID=UPI000F5296AC|nr:hypothetical protein [Ruminococcus sp. Marseille-P6503]